MQAYFRLKRVLKADKCLRGNVALHDMTPTTTMMDFRTAVLQCYQTDHRTSGVARLSGWLTLFLQNHVGQRLARALTASTLSYWHCLQSCDHRSGTIQRHQNNRTTYVPRASVRCEGLVPREPIKRLNDRDQRRH